MQVSNSDKLHIGIFGRVNSGKSSLLNALCGQQTAIVSNVRGTTTDPVYKPMEINGLGAVRLIDTAGIDDTSELGALRNAATDKAMDSVDVAIVVCGGLSLSDGFDYENAIVSKLKSRGIPYIAVYNSVDRESAQNENNYDFCAKSEQFVTVNALNGEGIEELIDKIRLLRDDEERSVLRALVKEGDTVVLVMPQDASAPKGRLILPQVKTVRELLDLNAIGLFCIPEKLPELLNSLCKPPDLIITDSQAFGAVSAIIPDNVRLTGFSVLLSAEKGDIAAFKEGANSMDGLNAKSRVLIAEACAHIPQNEDIGRVKIPLLLKQRYGVTQITHVNGNEFPEDLTEYDLIIHCGACMFNRRLVISRVKRAAIQGVPITNYGIALAKLQSILDKVFLPEFSTEVKGKSL